MSFRMILMDSESKVLDDWMTGCVWMSGRQDDWMVDWLAYMHSWSSNFKSCVTRISKKTTRELEKQAVHSWSSSFNVMSRVFLKTTREAGSASLALPPACLAGLDRYFRSLQIIRGVHTPQKRQFGRINYTKKKRHNAKRRRWTLQEENESCGVWETYLSFFL